MKGTPALLVDGMLVLDQNQVLNLDPADLESIEVIRSLDKLTQFGYVGQAGVLAIYSSSGKILLDEDKVKTRQFTGFLSHEVMVGPDHSGKDLSPSPDFRPVEYWNPVVQTDENGVAEVTFFTSDEISIFNIDVQGVSSDGKPGIGHDQFEVKWPTE